MSARKEYTDSLTAERVVQRKMASYNAYSYLPEMLIEEGSAVFIKQLPKWLETAGYKSVTSPRVAKVQGSTMTLTFKTDKGEMTIEITAKLKR